MDYVSFYMLDNYREHFDSSLSKINPLEYRKVYLVWHDQLSVDNFPAWVRDEKPLLLFIESLSGVNLIPHHKKKLVFLFSALRHFALDCKLMGFNVFYHSTYNDHTSSIVELLQKYTHWDLSYMQPNEWDSRKAIEVVKKNYPCIQEYSNTFFLAPLEPYVLRISKGWRLEFFYRDMRRRTGYLMDDEKPLGGEWNYDKENRKKLPREINLPTIYGTPIDRITNEVIDMVEAIYPKNFGISKDFNYGVTRSDALDALQFFLENALEYFGPYEDAMTIRGSVLYHSHLSMYLNVGLLSPKEVCDTAIHYFKNNQNIPISSIEGFIRQIIGWREYVRIYYEAMMPDIRITNYFNFERSLPAMYWTAVTEMKCMSECIQPVIENGYVHHIPRLMVLSNFSNLTGTDPRALNEWFWLGFIDAHEWVVLPNVLGMSTFADGGILASKPYVAGGNYINKMSDYCSQCSYSVKEKTGDNACPFNYLYWNFIDHQRETFNKNGRANFIVKTFDNKSMEEKNAIKTSSEKFLAELPRLSKEEWHNNTLTLDGI